MDKENNRHESLPLIPMQKGMLFHTISAPNSGVDVQHIAMTLNESININAFRSAWNFITARHETLRASFDWENLDNPISLVAEEVSLPITELDWRHLSKTQQEDQFQSLMEIDRQQGFNLSKPPLMRIMVIQVSNSITWCLWSFHHIILDGRSFPIVLQELFTKYDSIQSGKSIQLKDPFPFSDFVQISEAYNHSKSEKYWSELLEGFSAPTPLGLAHTKPTEPVASAVKNRVTFLSEHTVKQLNEFARDIGVTMNTLVQGAWGLLLHHYTAEKDIVFGNTRSGRNLYEPAKNSVGMFINTVPVRVKIDNQQTLVDYLRELRAQHISVREHESSPLSQIQKWSDVDGSDSLFHTLVVFESYDLSNVLRRNGGNWLKRKFSYQGQTSFPLTLMAYSDHQIRLRLEFDPQIFDTKTIDQILDHLKIMLQGMSDRPYSAAVAIPYLAEAEKEFLVNKVNPKVSSAGLEETVFETFSSLATKIPNKIAIIDENRSISYRELSDRSNQLANHLRSMGVKANTPIGICMRRGVDMVTSMLAILGSGGAYVPLDPTFPRERLAHMIEDSGINILVTEPDLESALPTFEGRKVILEKDRDQIFRQPITQPETISRINDLAYVIYTSGSTGKPKGVQVPHRAVSNFMLTMEAEPGITAQDCLLAVTTISFDISVLEIFLPLMVGAKVVLASEESAVDGRTLNGLMTEHGVTMMQATPATWRLLLDSGWNGKTDLKILCGGERLSKNLAGELVRKGDSLWNMYGPTETTIWSLIKQIPEDLVESADIIPIGRPIANTTVFILNENDELVPAGAPGELCIGGKGVTLGYINLEEQTNSKYFQTSFSNGLLYRTGDIARYKQNGDVVCLGRRDNQLKIRGFRIEPGEVEGSILSHASVKQVVAIGRPAQNNENQLVAYVVLHEGALVNVTELRKYASTRLPEYMVPNTWVLLDEMPLTDNGKIDRKQLPEPDGSRPELDNPFVAPKSKTEKLVANIWKGVLNINKPGVHDNFFDLGGDSLLVVSALTKLRNQTGTKLTVADLYALRTIRTLSEKIDALYLQPEQTEPTLPQTVETNQEENTTPLEAGSDWGNTESFDFVMLGGGDDVENDVADDVIDISSKEDGTSSADPEPSDNMTVEAARQSIDNMVSFDNWDWDDLDNVEDQEAFFVQKQSDSEENTENKKDEEDVNLVRPNTEESKTEYILDSPLSKPKTSQEKSEAFPIDFSDTKDTKQPEDDYSNNTESEKAEKTGEVFEFDFNDVDFGEVEKPASKKVEITLDSGPLFPETFSLNDVYLNEDDPEKPVESITNDTDPAAESDIERVEVDLIADPIIETDTQQTGPKNNELNELVDDIATEAEQHSDQVFEPDVTLEAKSLEEFDFDLADETLNDVLEPTLDGTDSLDPLSVLETTESEPLTTPLEKFDLNFEADEFDNGSEQGQAAELANYLDKPTDPIAEDAEESAQSETVEMAVEIVETKPIMVLDLPEDSDTEEVEDEPINLLEDDTVEPADNLPAVDTFDVATFDLEGVPVADLITESEALDHQETAGFWQEQSSDIAIIGMSGRFPGAKNLDEFWSNLVNGVEGLRHLTEDELRSVEIHYDEYKKDPDYVAATGLLDDVDMFDASFFGIKPVEARTLDPQQRLWFETAWETLENGGYDPKQFGGKIGVFAGSFMNSYVFYNLLPDRETIEDFVRLQAPESFMHMINNERDYMPTRTAYLFDLKGPAINVQTACSTSLVAVSLACRSILSGESDMALAGGVAIFLPQERGYFYQEGGMRSADGHCRPFDSQASGTVFASGLGCVLLKKLDQAIEDGDNILAVVKGTALNNDGTFKASYTAPSIAGQADVIRQAQHNAGIHPDSISYIEAHGTATPLGDPIEILGLSQAFDKKTKSSEKIVLGAVKSNIGHLDAAAGIAGLIKTVLSLNNETIPPTLHYNEANPEIDFEQTPFMVSSKAIDWPRNDDAPRRAGLSSFGVGGTNAHAILEEAPRLPESAAGKPRHLLLLSAKSETALAKQAENLAGWLANHPNANMADVAYTLTFGRAQHIYRRSLVVSDVAHAIKLLQDEKAGAYSELRSAEPEIIFTFPGQGAQFVGMGYELYQHEPVFKDAVDLCADILQSELDLDIRTILFSQDDEHAAEKLQQTGLAQPAIYTISYAQAMLWQSWGVVPDLMIGHSVGEFVAATLAGVFTVTDALKVIAGRAKLMQDLPSGSMVAVRLTEDALQPYLDQVADVGLAATNAPSTCIVSGPDEAIDQLKGLLEQVDQDIIELHTSHAFHSAMMDPILEPFKALVESTQRNEPLTAIISTVTGQELSAEEAVDPGYWASQLRQPVRFSQALQAALEDANKIFVEVGPGTNLSTSTRQHLPKTEDKTMPYFVVDSLGHSSKQRPALESALNGLGKLWLYGAEPDLKKYYEREKRRRVPLPTYPFERKRYWIDPPKPTKKVTDETALEAVTIKQSVLPVNAGVAESMEDEIYKKDLTMERYENIRAALVSLLYDLSGIEIETADYEKSFPELGFDSLTLTQVSTALRKQMDVTIRFRKLLEDVATINDLTAYCAENLPEDAYAAEPEPVQATAASAVPQPQMGDMQAFPQFAMPQMADPSAMLNNPMQMQLLQMQQMIMLMQQQMVMMQGQGSPMTAGAAQVVEKIVEVGRKWPKAPKKKEGDKVNKVTFGPYKPIKKGAKGKLTEQQQAWLDQFMERLQAKTAESKKIAQANRDVQADPRTVAGFRQTWKEIVYQVVTKGSKGSKVWDIDGNEYVDITMGFGVSFLGHSPDFVTEAVKEQLDKGIEIGPQAQLAGEVARMFREVTGMERVSFCNTGSEALTAAVRMSRTITGRDKIVYFSGDYHGVFDEVLARPQVMKGELMTVPAAPGITEDAVANAIILDYGTEASLEFIEEHKNDIAAVIIETVQSRHPENRPHEFVKKLREITNTSGTALVFDEVITGFRVHQGGMQQVYGVKPDIACYGKIIGGGIPIGVVAGSPRFMDTIDGGYWQYGDDSIPEVDLTFFAGTFVRHPMALAAAKAVLTFLQDRGPELQDWMNERTAKFATELNSFFEEQAVPIKINHYSSWFRVEVPTDYAYPDLIFYSLLEKGVYVFTFAQNCFFSIAHTDEDIEFVKQAFKETVVDLQQGGFLPTGPNSTIPFPLTEAQREIWLASQISEKAATSYNEGFSIRLTGDLNVNALQSAIETVSKRHSSLHLRFGEDGETQYINAERPVTVDMIDLSERSTEEAKADFGQYIDDLMVTPFDLKDGPLLKTSIVKFSPSSHVLLWVADHIVYDGWSAVVVISEIRAAYNAILAGELIELPPSDSFREYVSWEQGAVAGSEGEAILDYWVKQFDEIPAELELPTDFPRPVLRSYAGSSVHHELKGDLVDGVRELAKQNKTSTFVVMLAAFKAMLFKLSGNDDLVVGIHTAGQALAGLDNLVGHAVSILPIRSRPEDKISFVDFVAQVKNSLLDAQDNQPFTFGKLLQNLSIPRNPARSPLVEVVFNLDKKVPEDEFTGLEQVIREIPKQATNWDLFLNLYEDEGTLKADFDYNADLFTRETIQSWLDNFSVMLAQLLASPETSMGEVTFYPDTGLDPRMIEWNDTEQSFPTDKTLLDLISLRAARSPFKPAIIDRGSTYSYRDVEQRVNMLSRYFQTVGVSQGMLVGLCMERSTDLVISALAIMRAGAAYVPLDPDYPADRLRYMMQDSGMPLLVTKSDYVSLLPDMVRPIILDEEEPSIVRESNAPIQNIAKPDDLAYMIYTSGSSGQPKGVLVPHKALTNFLLSMQSEPGISAADVVVNVTTLSFDIAALELYLPLISGARLAIARPEVSTDGTKLATLLEEVEATLMQATPATWKLLLESEWGGRPALKMLCGGEPMSRQLANSLLSKGGELWNMYGPTETTIWSTIARIEDDGKPITIGRPIANTQVFILNQQMRPVPVGVEGDLYIGGLGLTNGYHKRAELTAEKYVANPFGDGKLYNTGDIARFNEDGLLVCLGRSDNQIKLRGFRIELGEIEAGLLAQPAISDAAVVLREDEPDDKRLVGYIIAAEKVDLNQVRENLRQRLPYYMIPSNFMILESFPLTPNGKIDRLSFPEPSSGREVLSAVLEQPSNPTEVTITEMWADVLKIDQESIGINDDFFELGGHSLLATRVISRIKKQFGKKLSLLTFFEGATVSLLAQQVGSAANGTNGQNGYPSKESSTDKEDDVDVEEFVI